MARILICYCSKPNPARKAAIDAAFKLFLSPKEVLYPIEPLEPSKLTAQVIVIDEGNWSTQDAISFYRELRKKYRNAIIIWSIWKNEAPPYIKELTEAVCINLTHTPHPVEHLRTYTEQLLLA